MFSSSSFLSFLLILAPFSTAQLVFDTSCKNFGSFGDVSNDLNQAYKDARTIAADAQFRVESLRNSLAGNQKGVGNDTEILRLERLLTAFFISPFKDASRPPLGRTPDNPGYEETSSALAQNLEAMNLFSVQTMPPMFCDPPVLSQDQAMGMTPAQLKGKWVKITKLPDGTDVLDPSTKKPSFFIKDYFNGNVNGGGIYSLPIGQDPCRDGAIAATNSDHWMLWCKDKYSLIQPRLVPTNPTKSENQHTDFSSLFYAASRKSDVDYWRTSIAITMLHEMHHVYIPQSTDIVVQIKYPSQVTVKAYAYAGTTQLAENVRVSSKWDELSQNADSMAIFAVAAYLDGCDWSMYKAKKLKQITDKVPTPPSNGNPSPQLKTTRRRSRNSRSGSSSGTSLSVSGRRRRNGGYGERRYVQKRSYSQKAAASMAELYGLVSPVSPIGGSRM